MKIKGIVRKIKFVEVVALTMLIFVACSQSKVEKMPKQKEFSNHLIHEKSPYLLQHAHNLVDWYPWGTEAFAKAQREDKPIFLSIGYSTCHWCHVMAHESFEDSTVARLMNETFVSIKVDREERPDIDKIYVTACQMMTGSGGWPLTIIMTPDKKPFFAGTYFPKESRFGRIGLLELIPRIRDAWENHREDLLKSAERVTRALEKSEPAEAGKDLDESSLQLAFLQLRDNFDGLHGGFGPAPKFPTPHKLSFLLRYWKRSGNKKALEMVTQTLTQMRLGGIYDQVGFGFHRYSTDANWHLPHFEKMLYDQALASVVYLEAFQVTSDPFFKQTVREILTYVERDMTSPQSAFYSAEDADSEGEEGKFYVWTEKEISALFPPKEAQFVQDIFGFEPGGNYREQATGRKTGANILHLKNRPKELAKTRGMTAAAFQEKLETIRKILFKAREKRTRPHKDDKILADWNSLMISAFARAGRVLADSHYVDRAKQAADFLWRTFVKPNGQMLHRYRDGEVAIAGTIDDYAFFIQALLDLYEASFKVEYLQNALALNRYLNQHFWDPKNGGYFLADKDAGDLLVRKKEIYDGALPSGNSVQLGNLERLAIFTGNAQFEEKATQLQRAFSASVRRLPSNFTQFLSQLDFAIGPSFEIVLSGEPQSAQWKQMMRAIFTPFIPNKVVLFRPEGKNASPVIQLAPYTTSQVPVNGKLTAYVCQNFHCNLPTTDVTELEKLLKENE